MKRGASVGEPPDANQTTSRQMLWLCWTDYDQHAMQIMLIICIDLLSESSGHDKVNAGEENRTI